ncbi:MAG TPA: CNNM domain-containing protein, partial [Chloroflexota bacterium]|nr:CNNM domain-containing protein [Chloroflexota bacterium]
MLALAGGLALFVLPMEGMEWLGGLLIASPLAGLAVLFAAAETAVAALRRPRVQQLVDEGSTRARSLQRLLEQSVSFVGAIRLVTTAAIIAANTLLVALFISPLSEAVGGELGA